MVVMSLELASRAGRNALADRVEAFGRWMVRQGRPQAGYAINGMAYGIRNGEISTAAQFALAATIDTLGVGADFEWQAEQLARYAVPFGTGAAVGAVGTFVIGPSSGTGGSVQRAAGKPPRKKQKVTGKYQALRLEPVGAPKISMQDETMYDLVQRQKRPSLQGPVSSQVPKLSTLARRTVARSKKRAFLVRHNRKLRAKALQSRFAYKRLILARLRRKRFVRKWVRSIRTRIGKRKRRYGALR